MKRSKRAFCARDRSFQVSSACIACTFFPGRNSGEAETGGRELLPGRLGCFRLAGDTRHCVKFLKLARSGLSRTELHSKRSLSIGHLSNSQLGSGAI